MNTNIRKGDEYNTSGSTFTEFLTITVKYRKFLFWFIFCITVSATAYALLAPKWYESVASVLPAERTDFLSSLSGLNNFARNFSSSRNLLSLTGPSESDKYLSILQSSTLKDEVINKFDLRQVYDMEDDYYEELVKELESNVEVEIQDEGNLTVTVYDKEPQRAADMANFMVERLNDINSQLTIVNAKANREFIEKRHLQNIGDIDSLETAMKNFQQKYGIVSMPDQIEASVKALTEIYASLAEKEIQLNVLSRTYSPDHPLVNNARIEIEELTKKLKDINAGMDISQADVSLIIPFKKAPELGNEYIKIYRSLEVQYKILEFVTPLYEQAKVEEVRNTPSVLILDKAFAADRKAKPKGTIFALVSFASSTILGFFIIFVKEFFEKIKLHDPSRYNFIFSNLKSDLSKLKLRKK